MKIVANVGVCDEIELIEAHLEHLAWIGVDHVFVTDTGSTDGTAEILRARAADGSLDLIEVDSSDPEAFHFANRMLHATIERWNPDWVLFSDADEFHLPRDGSLRDLLEGTRADVLRVPRFNLVLGPAGPCWPRPPRPANYPGLDLVVRPIPRFQEHLRAHPETPWILGFAAPKIVARPAALLQGIEMGAHRVATAERAEPLTEASRDLLIAHLPITTRERFLRKMANIEQVFRRVGHLYQGTQAWHWRRWLDLWQRGEAEAEYERQLFDAERLAALRSEGVVASAAEWFAARARPPSA